MKVTSELIYGSHVYHLETHEVDPDLPVAALLRSFFQCTLNIRKLYLLLGSSPTIDREFLPIMWIRSCFVKILSLVRVMFSETASLEIMSEPKLSRTLSSNKKIRDESKPSLPQAPNFDELSSEIVFSNGTDIPFAVIVTRKVNTEWLPICIRSSFRKTHEKHLTSNWPSSLWNQIEQKLNEHSKIETPRKTYKIDSKNDSKDHKGKNDSKLTIPYIGKKPNPGTSSICHVVTVTKTMSLVVMKGPDGGRKQKVTDDEISQFIDASIPLLLPSNIFNTDGVFRAKTLMQLKNSNDTHHLPFTALKGYSLWDGLEWSEHKQKQKLLNMLGLRKSTNSPVIAPLKSPYIKNLRRRRKKAKSTMNHGHLALFLGNDLSQIIS